MPISPTYLHKGATVYYRDALQWSPRERSCARRKALGRWGLRAVRERWGDRLQCSLRPDSAAAWVGVWLGQKAERGEKEVPDLTRNTASGQRFVDLICPFG